MTSKRWQDRLLLFGGIWLLIAPWTLETTSDVGSSWNAWTVAVLVIAAAWSALATAADTVAGWLKGPYGVWLYAARTNPTEAR